MTTTLSRSSIQNLTARHQAFWQLGINDEKNEASVHMICVNYGRRSRQISYC